ncbi:hypothetical protein M0802_006140 [Mischocyttarus mexicanus]|nr:hypothetical protein M0802_006140 [Mischocyttarus mexicanus]
MKDLIELSKGKKKHITTTTTTTTTITWHHFALEMIRRILKQENLYCSRPIEVDGSPKLEGIFQRSLSSRRGTRIQSNFLFEISRMIALCISELSRDDNVGGNGRVTKLRSSYPPDAFPSPHGKSIVDIVGKGNSSSTTSSNSSSSSPKAVSPIQFELDGCVASGLGTRIKGFLHWSLLRERHRRIDRRIERKKERKVSLKEKKRREGPCPSKLPVAPTNRDDHPPPTPPLPLPPATAVAVAAVAVAVATAAAVVFGQPKTIVTMFSFVRGRSELLRSNGVAIVGDDRVVVIVVVVVLIIRQMEKF